MKLRPILQQVSIKMKTMRLLSLLAIVCSILYGSPISAQVFPQENSVLNYRIIGFSFPAVPKATQSSLLHLLTKTALSMKFLHLAVSTRGAYHTTSTAR